MKNKFWKNKKVLITGYEGFLGSHLTKRLISCGANVIGLDIKIRRKNTILTENDYKKIVTIKGNVANYKLLKEIISDHNIEIIFHLAAEAIVGKCLKNPLRTFTSNIRGTWNILDVCRRLPIVKAIIIASSDKAYGEHERLPYTEDFSLSALHPYDASKACSDILARTYAHTYNLPLAVTRCSNIYGGGDINFSRIIPDTIRSVLKNKNPIIRSDGSPLRDYIYVEDVVQAYLTLAEHIGEKAINGQAFNFGTERPISVLELVNEIIKLSGRKSLRPIILHKGKLKEEIDRQYLDITKARRLLNWKPAVSLKEGLKKTITWYKEFFSRK